MVYPPLIPCETMFSASQQSRRRCRGHNNESYIEKSLSKPIHSLLNPPTVSRLGAVWGETTQNFPDLMGMGLLTPRTLRTTIPRTLKVFWAWRQSFLAMDIATGGVSKDAGWCLIYTPKIPQSMGQSWLASGWNEVLYVFFEGKSIRGIVFAVLQK